MKTKNNTENSSEQGTAQAKVTENEKAPINNKTTPTKSFLRNSFNKIGFALIFLLIGALFVGLALYLPAQTNLKSAQTELDRLQPIETEYIALVQEHEIVNARSGVYKALSDTSMLHLALSANDQNRIDQYSGYIEEDLKKLVVPNFPDLPASLSNQFAKVMTSSATNRPKAINELQDFQNDLLAVVDNL